MSCSDANPLVEAHGRSAVVAAVRQTLADARTAGRSIRETQVVLQEVGARLEDAARPSLRQVFNLSGTVLHTNLGRALLPPEAVAAITAAARGPVNLEYDLDRGERGERDEHLEHMLCEPTGAEAATVVNNNAAALFLVLNTPATGRQVPTSRGELVEIGGSFRLPEIMVRSGCRLVEVGTTNRTHLHDFARALGADTGMVLKVHASNFSIEGFTASVATTQLAALCREHRLPLVIDLGSGALVDLTLLGLPHEATVPQALRDGADLVTFSTDKLLGGPQAGVVAGRRELVEQVRHNPLKRALRVDKLTTAALAEVLRLYRDPERLPTLRLLARPQPEVRGLVQRIAPALKSALGAAYNGQVVDCASQVGSGALPVRTLPSAGLAIAPGGVTLAQAFRRLPVPVVGRLHDGQLVLDLHCLEDEAAFLTQLPELVAPPAP